MYSRILVAIDGSPAADLALTEAVRLARTQDATLRIAHVIDGSDIDVDQGFVLPREIRTVREKAGRDMLAEAAAFAKAAGLRVETRLLEIERNDQRVVDVLAEEAKAWPAELVVIGAQGRRAIQRPLLGSVADEFMRITAEPVLVVREPHPD